MSDFLKVEVLGERTLLRNLQYMPDTVRAILLVKTEKLTAELKKQVEENIRKRLNKTDKVKAYSGSARHLADSVESEVTSEGMRVEGRVYIDGIIYARIQEEGGIIPAHIIQPKRGRVLAFMGATGEKVFATKVFHPGAVIPATYYMKDARRQQSSRVGREIKKAVVEGIRARMRAS